MKSLRTRLLVGMIASLALVLLTFGLLIDALIEFMFVREFDFYLETVARTLAAAAEAPGQRLHVKLVPEDLADIPETEGELFSQYWNGDGSVLARSKNLSGHDLPRFAGKGGIILVQPVILPDGQRARAAAVRFLSPAAQAFSGVIHPDRGDDFLTLVVARETNDLESHIQHLRWLLFASGTGAMTLGALVSVVVIRRSLRPLHRVAAAIAAIREDDLSARIPATTMPDEIVPLVQRLNELLHRLDEAFARERSLTADIAHELRTPVAGILSTAGVTLSANRDAAEYQEALEDVRGIARRMRSMIENLLTLARLDAQPAQFRIEPVALRELVELCWHGCRDKAAARQLTFENRAAEDLCCHSDRNALAIVLVNLLENAVEYTNRTGRIWITAADAGGVTMEVANTGCKLGEEQVAHVFDRFWRGDASRKDTTLHVGLGLALVRRIITSLGGTVEASVASGNFTVSIRLPEQSPA